MKNVFNRENEPWVRPWNVKKFDDLYNRDERFFSIIVKGLISWLNTNIVLYDESINHFIFNTGSSYLYMESNGYEYNFSETTGEDAIYMKLPRCIIELQDVNFPTEELTSPFARGNYERRNGNMLSGFNAEIRRLPLEISFDLKYYLANFNETLILLQELIDKLVFQQYFNITYLGQIIQCSIEFPGNVNPEINKIDMSSPDPKQRNITMNVKVCTNYPLINLRTEIATDKVIAAYGIEADLYNEDYQSDHIEKGSIMNNNIDEYKDFIKSLDNSDKEISELSNLEDLIKQYDTNNDGIINEDDIEYILEHIKYNSNDSDVLNYSTLTDMINILNHQENMSVDYDEFTKSLYVLYKNTGETKQINLNKYKIQKDE